MEDVSRKLVEGRGQFVNDLHMPDMLHLAIVRSPHASAKLLKVKGGINSSELKANLASVGEGASEGPGAAQPVLAIGYVNYVGQPVAAVLGNDQYTAIDMMDEVEVDYEPLKPVIDPEEALVAPPIHLETTSNVLASFQFGKEFDLPDAPLVLEDTLLNKRISPNPLEPRARGPVRWLKTYGVGLNSVGPRLERGIVRLFRSRSQVRENHSDGYRRSLWQQGRHLPRVCNRLLRRYEDGKACEVD